MATSSGLYGKLFYLQYYENIILNNIIFLYLFMIVISIVLKYNDVLALMLLCILFGSWML